MMAEQTEGESVVDVNQQASNEPSTVSIEGKTEENPNAEPQDEELEDEPEALVRPAPYADRSPIGKYEYLDHTADVQLHSWGDSLKESFEQIAIAMFDYMTDITLVEKEREEHLTVEGDDLNSLLFHFLDEWLFLFSADPFFIPREVVIDEFDVENFKIICRGIGETFDLCKHPQGTEVKAITYSNMQVHDKDPTNDLYVIIDI